ncbi:M61 family metallopeptidase [Shewanella sp. 202IG2-18]|uniref:M61 family metallopeptidase n=1 Tax=Parashewanella hymeniacidonis TaxID=2807618 RepID=UPI001960C244|nr:PDZ domain-containing protein [Parashewanella hymeniacidonis]MBM7073708.1 M61 family metallopeptidase [Parashewanella hymeniacidonis]
MIHYQITPSDPKAHLFFVKMTLDSVKKGQTFWLPSWLPGSYMVRDFCRNIIGINCVDAHNQQIVMTQTDKQTWIIDQDAERITLSYQVYAWDLSVRSAHLDSTHGFFNGSSVFLAAKGLEHSEHSVTINKPTDASLENWRLATAMTRTLGQHFEFGSFSAESYDELIDHPVEMGDFTSHTFEANGIPHDIVLTGRHYCDLDRLSADLKKICEYQLNLFNNDKIFDRYLFLTTVLGNGFGGLEHRASTALVCSRSDLPTVGMQDMTKGYQTYLSLCSHEYFHNWNVKRIKPKEFTPYQLKQESYTKQLWAYEGITSYYDDLITYLSGTVTKDNYLKALSKTFTRVYRGSGRFKQTLRDSSFNAWTKFYKQDENAANAIVSYYTKGAIFALYLDLTIRKETANQHSINDVMQALWEDFGSKGIGTLENSHQQIVEKLLERNCDDIFAYLDKTDDIPVEPLLKEFGVQFELRSNNGSSDTGGGKITGNTIDFGAKYKTADFGISILAVLANSAAHKAGLSAGDKLIAIDNLQTTSDFEKQLQLFTVGQSIPLHWFRRDELMTGKLEIKAASLDTVSLHLADETLNKNWLN